MLILNASASVIRSPSWKAPNLTELTAAIGAFKTSLLSGEILCLLLFASGGSSRLDLLGDRGPRVEDCEPCRLIKSPHYESKTEQGHAARWGKNAKFDIQAVCIRLRAQGWKESKSAEAEWQRLRLLLPRQRRAGLMVSLAFHPFIQRQPIWLAARKWDIREAGITRGSEWVSEYSEMDVWSS